MKHNADLIPTVIPCSSLSIRTDFSTNKTPWTVLDGYVNNYLNAFAPWHQMSCVILCSFVLYNNLSSICRPLILLIMLYLDTTRFFIKRKIKMNLWNVLIWQCHLAVTKRKDSKFHHWHASWISTHKKWILNLRIFLFLNAVCFHLSMKYSLQLQMFTCTNNK